MEIINVITTYFSGTWGMVELFGTIFSLICVFLAARHNQWTWFFGALGVILFGALFYEFKLYSDAGLQILFFLPIQVWGFFVWRKMAKDSQRESITKSLTQNSLLLIVVAIGLLTVVNGYVMMTYTDASFPLADAWTTWMSVFAQILMVRKYWQSWALWTIMDVGAIYIYFAKGLFVVSGLYFVFLCIAAYGTYKWYNDWKESELA
jgi:nicotinamide mononucleotide transporter